MIDMQPHFLDSASKVFESYSVRIKDNVWEEITSMK